ncbi:MAG: hypothetical protein KDD37_05210, partial [Bdellovibrionales bacterium]|nr:hypothetical protein [Bdellovibrionales bacterium]
MRRLLLIFLILSPLLANAEPVKTAYRPKLIIFIIHGFLGGPDSFCDMSEVLKEKLGYGVEVEYLTYPTKGLDAAGRDSSNHVDNVNVLGFTRKIFEDIANYYDENMYPADTPYAIITHSQGGLVATRLFLDCHQKGVEYCTRNIKRKSLSELPKNMTHYFSIMTPFWGSTTATYLKDSAFYRKFFPNAQLHNLSVGSDIVTYNRSLLMEGHQHNYQIKQRPEVINIAGNASQTWLGSLISWISDKPQNQTLETDFVVPIPSARLDFMYYDYTKDSPKIGKTEYADYFYSLNGNHIDVPMSDEGLACVSWKNYLTTPTFPIIRKHLAPMLGLQENPIFTNIFKDMSIFPPNIESFILEVQLEIPKDMPKIFNFDTEDIEVSIKNPMTTKLYKLHRKNDLMNSYLAFNTDEYEKNSYVTYYATGTFLDEFSYVINRSFKTDEENTPTEDLEVKINLPWFKSKTVDVKVSPSYTTYTKVKLDPKWNDFVPTVDIDKKTVQPLSIMHIKNQWRILTYNPSTQNFDYSESSE